MTTPGDCANQPVDFDGGGGGAGGGGGRLAFGGSGL